MNHKHVFVIHKINDFFTNINFYDDGMKKYIQKSPAT